MEYYTTIGIDVSDRTSKGSGGEGGEGGKLKLKMKNEGCGEKRRGWRKPLVLLGEMKVGGWGGGWAGKAISGAEKYFFGGEGFSGLLAMPRPCAVQRVVSGFVRAASPPCFVLRDS